MGKEYDCTSAAHAARPLDYAGPISAPPARRTPTALEWSVILGIVLLLSALTVRASTRPGEVAGRISARWDRPSRCTPVPTAAGTQTAWRRRCLMAKLSTCAS